MHGRDRDLWRVRMEKEAEKPKAEGHTGTRVHAHGPCQKVARKASLMQRQRFHTGTRVQAHGPCEKMQGTCVFGPRAEKQHGRPCGATRPVLLKRADFIFHYFSHLKGTSKGIFGTSVST